MKLLKRAALQDNVLGIIIAVLGLALIVVLAIKLYSVVANQEEQSAQALINSLEAKINAFDLGQNGSVTIQGFKNTNQWSFVGWGKNEAGRPDKCYFKSCLCICPGVESRREISTATLYSITNIKKDAAASCQKSGYCRFFDSESITTEEDFVGVEKTLVETPAKENFSEPSIRVPNNLILIRIEKSDNLINLTASTGEFKLPYELPIS